jgi:hypothetical protein
LRDVRLEPAPSIESGEESKAKKAPAYAGAFALRDGQKAGATYQPAKKRPAVIQVATAFGIEQ